MTDKRKRVWGVNDPFEFAPCEFHMGLLQAVEPFLRIHADPRDLRQYVRNDKFEGGKMDKDALAVCLHLVSFGLSQFERTYKDPKHELGFPQLHLEMIRQVEQFTRSTEHSFIPMLEGDDEDQKGFFVVQGSCTEENEEPLDVDSPNAPGGSGDSLTHSTSSGDDQDGYEMDTDTAPHVPGKGRTDCRGFVFNEGPRLLAGERLSLKAERCAFVGEFERNKSDDAIPQAAGCARAEVRLNLSNRHYKPLYLLGLSESKFTYAVLKVQGSIATGGDSVSDRAYEDYVATTEPGSTPYSKAEIEQMLRSGTKFYRANYRAKSQASYLKREYIVGDLYLAPGWYMLPSNEVYQGMQSPDARKFYEGLLRIVVGDRVLKFKASDMMQSAARRMVQSFNQMSHGGLDVNKWAATMTTVQSLALGLRVRPRVELDDEEEPEVKRRHL